MLSRKARQNERAHPAISNARNEASKGLLAGFANAGIHAEKNWMLKGHCGLWSWPEGYTPSELREDDSLK